MSFLKYRIAELNVLMQAKGALVLTQAAAYAADFDGTPDITIDLSDEFIDARQAENPLMTREECEYFYTGMYFYYQLLRFQGLMVHASALAYQNRAYLFSAPSGTGKSTHVGLWQKYLGADVAVINDDKPAIRILPDGLYVYGTPWSGKTDKNTNVKVPLGGIVFLERAPQPDVRPMKTAEAVQHLLWQTTRSAREDRMQHVLDRINAIMGRVPIYKMGVNMEQASVELSFTTLTGQPWPKP